MLDHTHRSEELLKKEQYSREEMICSSMISPYHGQDGYSHGQ